MEMFLLFCALLLLVGVSAGAFASGAGRGLPEGRMDVVYSMEVEPPTSPGPTPVHPGRRGRG